MTTNTGHDVFDRVKVGPWAKPVDMQRRHFEFIAEILRDYPFAVSDLDLGLITQGFADRLARTNPNFNRERFLQACKRR